MSSRTNMGTAAMRRRTVLVLLLLLLVGGAVLLLAPGDERAAVPVQPPHEPVARVPAEPQPPPVVEPDKPEVVPESPPPLPEPAPVLQGRPKEHPPQPEEPEPLPFVSGRVEDADGHPIADVAVLARQTRTYGYGTDARTLEQPVPLDAPEAVFARTSDDGTFAIAEVPHDFLCLLFVKPGWAASELRTLSKDRAENQDLVVVLEPGRTLQGIVRDTQGKGIPHASVFFRVKEEHPWRRIYTSAGEDGRYALQSLPPLPGAISASAAGYPDSRSRETSVSQTREDFTLRRARLLVDVTDATTGAPLTDATGFVLDASTSDVVGVMTSDNRWRGCVAIPGRLFGEPPFKRRGRPQPDEVRVLVLAPNHLPHTELLRLAGTSEMPHLVIRLTRGTAEPSLAGRILGAEQAVVEVRACDPHYAEPKQDEHWDRLVSERTGPDGTFSFASLPAGRYRLLARAPGYGPVSLDATAPDSDIEIHLHEAAALDVYAHDGDKQPVPSAWITLESPQRRARWYAQAGEDGVAHFEGLPAERMALVALKTYVHDSQGVWRSRFHLEVELKPGETAHAEIQVPRHVSTTIRVLDSAGRPQTDVELRLRRTWPYCETEPGAHESRVSSPWPRTNAAGEAVVELFPGRYEVIIEGRPSGPHRHEFYVDLQPGSPVELVLPSGSGVVYGRVLERGTRQPIVGRPIYVAGTEGEYRRLGQAVTDAQGGYEIGGLPEGPIQVSFELRSNAEGFLEVREAEDGTAELVSPFPRCYAEIGLRRGERREVGAIVPRVRGEGAAEKTFELDVRVTDEESSEPIARAQAFAAARIGDLWIEAGQLKTNSRGTGTGRLLASDRYRIRVFGPRSEKGPRYLSKRVEIVVRGNHGAIDVELPRAPAED